MLSNSRNPHYVPNVGLLLFANIFPKEILQSSVIKWLAFKPQVPLRTCEDCGGSGLCSECKGEGFVLKKLSDENAERARLAAKNMATRFTAAYNFLAILSLLSQKAFNFKISYT